MKFTSVAIAALFLAESQAVLLKDDCKGKWCNKGLPYDLDVPTLNKAEADNVAKTHAFNGATKADAGAAAAAGAAGADAAAKADAAAAFAGTSYKDKPAFAGAEAANAAAVKAKEAALDASLKADDAKVAADLVAARKARDLAAATAAKAASEKDQLERGQNQDRLKFVNENTAAKTSEIQGKHDERERANGRLLKALASF